jgi:hypothetical protein
MSLKFFLIISISNFLNNYFYQFLILIFFIKGDFSTIADIVFFIAPIIFLKDSLSSHKKILIISDKNRKNIKPYFKQRIYYTVYIALLYIGFFFYVDINQNVNFFILIAIVIVILLLWLHEIILSFYEIYKRRFNIFISLSLLLLIYSSSISFVYLSWNFSFYLCVIFLVILLVKEFFNEKLSSKNNSNQKISYFTYDMKFFSTFSTNISNLLWRYSIYFLLDKHYSGMLFAIFALSSFPSSFYNNVMGMTVEINKNVRPLFSLILLTYFTFFISSLIYAYYYKISLNVDYKFIDFFLISALMSLLGSIIMIFSISKRLKLLHNFKNKRNNVFKLDIIYGATNILTIFFVYYVLDVFGLAFIFLISAILSLVYPIFLRSLVRNA